MLTFQSTFANNQLARRAFLRIGALGGVLTLADQLRARAESPVSGETKRDKSVILICLPGGQSQLDTYDLKPDAPVEIRGDFKPIPTVVRGVEISEHFPLQAAMFDRFALLRSVVSLESEHSDSIVMTGASSQAKRITGSPSFGSVISKTRGVRDGVPPFVSLCGATEGSSPGALGQAYKPFTPSGPDVLNLRLTRGMTATRFNERTQLLSEFDSLRRKLDNTTAEIDPFQRQAIELILSGKIRRALDLSNERFDTVRRYNGIEDILKTIRLIEAGVGCVTLRLGQWDHHNDIFRDLKSVMAIADRAICALIDGLHERGLAEDVVTVVSGEFGRTPRVNKAAGRDHWPSVMSVLVAGGGLRLGQVIGATNRLGEYPTVRPLSASQILATVYRAIGINPASQFTGDGGRPMSILENAEAIHELL